MFPARTIFCLLISHLMTTASPGQFSDVSDQYGFGGGGKAAFGDFNNDGFVDFYTGSLWRNENGLKFENVDNSGIGSGEGIWGDYDNDGKRTCSLSQVQTLCTGTRGTRRLRRYLFLNCQPSIHEVQYGSISTMTACLICTWEDMKFGKRRYTRMSST